jgi:acyl carrier protein
MRDLTYRLTGCFEIVFPGMARDKISSASQQSVSAWDSVAAITLANVIEEEFGIELDLDQLADLDSFERIREYLLTQTIPA